jgi:5-methylcytosine-specific restriction endonuclease McrA
MLHRDTTARFQKSGLWLLAQYRLVIGNTASARRWNAARASDLLRRQQSEPVALLEDGSRRRTWWMFRNEIYWEEDGLDATQVKALALERLTKKDRRIARAVALMEQTDTFTSTREPIPDDVRVFVWNRDGGRCIRCQSKERLEFDHIIPIALGGANTARNLQLLCETCNREKGASIA